MISGRSPEGHANAVLRAGIESRPSTTSRKASRVPWWGIALIAVASAAVGAWIAYAAVLAYISRGMRG